MRAIDCLKSGRIQHAIKRSGKIDDKNHLAVGAVSVEEVIELINSTKGDEFETSYHHVMTELEVHIFKPRGWYIKCYFIEPDIFFISVHR